MITMYWLRGPETLWGKRIHMPQGARGSFGPLEGEFRIAIYETRTGRRGDDVPAR